MNIGLIDVDGGKKFPNIPLMKLSAWHKSRGDSVEWYDHASSGHMDIVYMSKVFSFSKDYEYHINADKIIRGGSGYCIELEDGKERYCAERDKALPDEVEHIYPDYSIYPELTKDTAFGFLTRGCPRKCDFCHVKSKPADGPRAHKVADLREFWNGQKNLILCDPNILACRDHLELLEQVAASGARVNFNQGLDVRLMNEKNLEVLKRIRLKSVHLAFDRYQDWDLVTRKLTEFKIATGLERHKVSVYILVNFDTTLAQDLDRIYFVRSLKLQPYVMIYDKEHAPAIIRKMQRWSNSPPICWTTPRFEDYTRLTEEERKEVEKYTFGSERLPV